jgi:hypothetical protein
MPNDQKNKDQNRGGQSGSSGMEKDRSGSQQGGSQSGGSRSGQGSSGTDTGRGSSGGTGSSNR